MRKIVLLVAIAFVVLSCNQGSKESQRILADSAGPINHVSVVVNNELWKNTVGEAIRDVLAAPIDGFPQEEPLFSINQYPPQVFTGFAKEGRNVLKVMKGAAGFNIKKDAYARPQTLITVSGKDIAEIKTQISKNAESIVKVFKATDIKKKQADHRKSLYNAQEIEKVLGVKIQFSSAYRIANTIAKAEDKFFWIKRDIPTGYTNVLLYEIPLNKLQKKEDLVGQVIKIRDSIGKKYIGGPVDGSYMGTEMAYAPHIYETIIDNKPTVEVKGLWDAKQGAVMSGPFITYFIEDKVNQRYIVAEGFAFAPSVSKRNFMFELEAMIKSIKIN